MSVEAEEARFTPTVGLTCEATLHDKQARWQGPPTYYGGNLWCGECKRRYLDLIRQGQCPAAAVASLWYPARG